MFFLFIFVFFKLLSCLKYDKIILDLGGGSMLKQEKLDTILEIVNTKGTITVKEIMNRLDISDMTARRYYKS